MKKITFALICICFIGMSSCTKETVSNIEENNSINTIAMRLGGSSPTRTFKGIGLDCKLPAEDCMEEFILIGTRPKLALSILNNKISTSKTAVYDFMQTQDAGPLVEIFGNGLFENLKNGTLTVMKENHLNKANTSFYLFGDFNNFTIQNPDIVVPVNFN